MEHPSKVLEYNDPAFLKHVETYQNIISRMAGNSSACKNWCLVLVAAFLAFVIKDGHKFIALLGFVPVLVFWGLDAYYLALEQQFRNVFNDHMKKMRDNVFTLEELFAVQTDGRIPDTFSSAFRSPATWPVYTALIALIILSLFS